MAVVGWLSAPETAMLKISAGTCITYSIPPIADVCRLTISKQSMLSRGVYVHSVKEPDAMIRHHAEILPSLTIEVGWSESYPKLYPGCTGLDDRRHCGDKCITAC